MSDHIPAVKLLKLGEVRWASRLRSTKCQLANHQTGAGAPAPGLRNTAEPGPRWYGNSIHRTVCPWP